MIKINTAKNRFQTVLKKMQLAQRPVVLFGYLLSLNMEPSSAEKSKAATDRNCVQFTSDANFHTVKMLKENFFSSFITCFQWC
jgi:hypothetical protein